MKRLLALALAVWSTGCLLDSVEPWLSPETIVPNEIAIGGTWTVLDEVEMYGAGSETVVTLTHKPATPRRGEFFYIKVRPKSRDTQFIFQATLHEIEGLRFLQVWNFTHSDQQIFGLAHRPTYSLWRVEADEDNIILWMPDLDLSRAKLKTLQDQDDKVLFVDAASNNERAVRDWARLRRLAGERPRNVLPLALTRTGTEFALPASARLHLPAELAKPSRSEATPSPSGNDK